MFGLFAVTDPQTTLTSGNAIAILALIIIVLAGVVVYLVRKLEVSQRDSAAEIKALNVLLLQELKTHTEDYREMAKNDQTILQGNSQTNQLLAAKIEAVQGKH